MSSQTWVQLTEGSKYHLFSNLKITQCGRSIQEMVDIIEDPSPELVCLKCLKEGAKDV